jgi:hypothetical protein
MKKLILICLTILVLFRTESRASVFTIPQFVEYRSWAVGLEPEATFSTPTPAEGTGISLTAKFTYGITPISNLQIGLGPGSGNRTFDIGGTYSFDFIPDLKGQVGAGIAAQAYYFSIKDSSGKTEITAYPYVHKMFPGPKNLSYDPYLAMPVGFSFLAGTYQAVWQLSTGCYVKTSDHFGVNAEFGLSLQNTDTYLSLGATYRD